MALLDFRRNKWKMFVINNCFAEESIDHFIDTIRDRTGGKISPQHIIYLTWNKFTMKPESYARFDFMKDLDRRFQQYKEANSCDMAIVFVRKNTNELAIHRTFEIIGDHYNISTQVVSTRPANGYDGYIPTVDNILINIHLSDQSSMELVANNTYND